MGDDVFHTYSTYARDVEPIIDTYSLLDMTPYGRQEDFEDLTTWLFAEATVWIGMQATEQTLSKSCNREFAQRREHVTPEISAI